MIANFYKNRQGNFAMMFAILAVPLLGSIGLAVDYANITKIRAHLQNAADNAALVAAKEHTMTNAERKALAEKFFDANREQEIVRSVDVKLGKESATVTVRARPKTYFLTIFDAAWVDMNVSSTANAPSSALEVVFALDVSGSMNATMSSGKKRIDELKAAAKKLLARLQAETDYTVSAGYVPFNVTVNIGKGNTALVTGHNGPLFAGTEWKGCVFEPAPPNHIKDSPTARWEAYVHPPFPNIVGMGDWGQNKSNGTNAGYATLSGETGASATDFSVQHTGPNFNCVRHPVQPLTTDLTALGKKIDSLTAEYNNGTLLAPGVTWAMRLLSPGAPFTEGGAYGPGTNKVIIVVTDGEQVTEAEFSGDGVANNSRNSSTAWSFNPANYGLGGSAINTGFGPKDNLSAYGFIRDSDPFGDSSTNWTAHKNALVNLSDAACAEAKKPVKSQRISIFSIGVSDATAPGTLAYKALNNCASTPDKHFYVQDKAALDKAFDSILKELKKLRVTS